MKNIEKYKKEIKELNYDFALINNELRNCTEVGCCDCQFNYGSLGCKRNVIGWLLKEYKEPIKPILTEKEKAYLKNVIEPYGNNTAYVCRFITETLRKEFLSICINVDENSINSFEIPLIHGLKTWYKNMVLDKEYTLEELGL